MLPSLTRDSDFSSSVDVARFSCEENKVNILPVCFNLHFVDANQRSNPLRCRCFTNYGGCKLPKKQRRRRRSRYPQVCADIFLSLVVLCTPRMDLLVPLDILQYYLSMSIFQMHLERKRDSMFTRRMTRDSICSMRQGVSIYLTLAKP